MTRPLSLLDLPTESKSQSVSQAMAARWYLKFYAADGTAFAPGHYADAMGWPFQGAGHPGLSIYGNGRGSNQITGSSRSMSTSGTPQPTKSNVSQHRSSSTTRAGRGPHRHHSVQLLVRSRRKHPRERQRSRWDPLQSVITTGPSHGSISIDEDGTLAYSPDSEFSGRTAPGTSSPMANS